MEKVNMNCDDLFTEVDASASFQAEVVNGEGQSLVTTIVQGLLGCGVSYLLGNQGYGCTVTDECVNNCRLP